jgi:HK97 family phage portal protein
VFDFLQRAFTWIWSNGITRYQGYQSPGPTAYESSNSPPVSFDAAMQLSTVWACVKLLAETVASLPLYVYERTPDGRRLVTDHPLAKLFAGQVNRYQNRIEFFETVVLNLVMTGNAYVAIERLGGEVISLLPLMSAQMQTRLLPDGSIVYEYTNEAGLKVYAAESIWHLKLMGNGTIGLSVLDYQRDTLNIARGAERSVGKIYANGGKPSGVLMIDRVLTPEQREMVRANFNGLTEGDAQRLFVLEAGAKYEQVSLSPQDIELLSSRRYNVEELCRWYGVPSVMVNQTSGSTWGSGISQIVEGFYKLTLRPVVEKIELSGQIKLMSRDDRARYEIEFDFDALLRADVEARSRAYQTLVNTGVMTPQEARDREGLPAMPGANQLLVQGAMVPITMAGALSRPDSAPPA